MLQLATNRNNFVLQKQIGGGSGILHKCCKYAVGNHLQVGGVTPKVVFSFLKGIFEPAMQVINEHP
jgi:hypothetical protein